jgi:hypothetical protein
MGVIMATVNDVFGAANFAYISPYFTAWKSANSIPYTLSYIQNKVLVATTGSQIKGGKNDDEYYLTKTGSINLDSDGGNDIIVLKANNSSAQGQAGKDFIMGIGDNNFLHGGNDADFVVALGKSNFLHGGSGNDYLIAIAPDNIMGNNIVSGDTGNDIMDVVKDFYATLQFNGLRSSYTITRSGTLDGTYTITGPDGTDTLIAHRSNFLKFDDMSIQLKSLFADRAPVANPDTNVISEDAISPVIGNVITNDKDPDLDPIHVSTVNGTPVPATPAGLTINTSPWGTLVMHTDGSYSFSVNHPYVDQLAQGATQNVVFNYVIASDYFGPGSSPSLSSSPTTLTITIQGVNDAPTANPDPLVATTNQNTMIANLSPALLANDTDPDTPHTLSVASVSGNSHITLVSGNVVFTPGTDFIHLAEGATATVNFNYVAKDEYNATSNSTSASILVTGLNDAPIAINDGQIASIDQSTSPTTYSATLVLGNDIDPDDGHVLSIDSVSGDSHITLDGFGNIVFTPGTDFDYLTIGETATVNFSYSAKDEHDAVSNDATASILINGVKPAEFTSTADVLGGPKQLDGQTTVRDYISGVSVDAAAQYNVAVANAAGWLTNYVFSLNATGIFVHGVHDGAVDGDREIPADTSTVVNNVLNPQPNTTVSVDIAIFGDPHEYLLYNGAVNPPSNEWITALNPDPGQEGALIVAGDYSANTDYYVIQGNAGNDILIGGNNTSTGSTYGYFLIGEGGSNVIIGGNNSGNYYYVGATDNNSGGYSPSPLVVGNSILVGGSNTGSGVYYELGAQGNDLLILGANGPSNVYDQYYVSGGGGTNLFVSNLGKHLLDGSSGNNALFNPIADGSVNHINDVNDTVQYHQDVLGGAGDVRSFLSSVSPTYAQMNAVSQALISNNLLNFSFSLIPAAVDNFAYNGGILVATQNADTQDLIVGNTVAGARFIDSPLSSIPNIDFNAASDLSGTNFGFTLFNGPASSSSLVFVTAGASDAIELGGDNNGSGYTLTGGAGNDILEGGANTGGYVIDGGAGNNIVIGGVNFGGEYVIQAEGVHDVLIGGSNFSGLYILQDISSGLALFYAGPNSGGTIEFVPSFTGDMLSYINISAGVTVDLGQISVTQNTIGDGENILDGFFSILQGTNFDDYLSFTSTVHATPGGSFGNPALVNITNESFYGMDGNDVIRFIGTAFGGSGDIANEASGANSTNAHVIISSDLLDAGLGTSSQNPFIFAEAIGGNANSTFGNHAINGATAISADVDISFNTLTSENQSGSDVISIYGSVAGGNAGSASWDGTDNTGANIADGMNSTATSANVVIDHNTLSDLTGDATILIDGESFGGSSHTTLYANNALNDGTAISAHIVISDNVMEGGHTSPLMEIFATALCGDGTFSANVSGYDNDPVLTIPGGTAIGALVDINNNTMTAHGGSNFLIDIEATATGGHGNFYGNFAYQGTAIAAEVNITDNTLTGDSGNDILLIDAFANAYVKNGADGPDAFAIDTKFIITGNHMQGGIGDDTIGIFIYDHPSGLNVAFNGAAPDHAVSMQLSLTGNELLGGAGNDLFTINSSAFFGVYNDVGESNNLIDGGTGFNTLQLDSGSAIGNIDLTALTVDTGGTSPNSIAHLLENLDRLDLTGAGVNNLTMNATEVNALNNDQTLVVKGDASEAVTLNDVAGTWTQVGTNVAPPAVDTDPGDAGLTFNHFQATVASHTVDLFVQSAVVVIHS